MITENERLLKKINREKAKRVKIEESGKRGEVPNLIEISDALDDYYFLNKIRIYCVLLSHKNIYENSKLNASEIKLIHAILESIHPTYENNPGLYIYNRIRMLFESLSKQQFELLKAFHSFLLQVDEYCCHHAVEDGMEIYSLLANYCNRRINLGHKEFAEQSFIVNNRIINLVYGKRGKKKNVLNAGQYKNMIVVALKFIKSPKDFFAGISTENIVPKDRKKGFKDGFEWVEKFMHYYSAKLSPENRELYFPYCQALMYFLKNDFENAFNALQTTEYLQSTFINVDTKILYLQILYELESMGSGLLDEQNGRPEIIIDKEISTYRGVVRNLRKKKTVISYHVDYYKQFHDLFNNLFKLYSRFARIYKHGDKDFDSRKTQLFRTLQSIDYSYKDWFLRKLEEI